MKKILFGLNQSADKTAENTILKTYIKTYQEEFTFKSEYYLEGIRKSLDEEHYDCLVLIEDLEGNNKVTTGYLDEITDRFPRISIVLIIDDTHQKDEYVKKLFNMGIYNIIYKEDATISNIVELIYKSREKYEAKIYLDIDEVEDIEIKDDNLQEIPETEIVTILFNINNTKPTDTERFLEIFEDIYRQYSEKQILFLFSILPEETLDKFKETGSKEFLKIYSKYKQKEQTVFEEDRAREVSIKKATEIVTKEIVKEKIVFNIPSDYNKIVAFVGNRKTGTTTIVDLVARYFSSRDKNVATLDLTSNKTLYYLNSWGNEEIGLEERKGLQLLEKGIKRPIYVNEKYKLYTNEADFKESAFDFFTIIEQIRYDNDIILIDMGFDTRTDFLKHGVNAIFLVQDMNLIDIRETKNYIKKIIEEGVNERKISLIINKKVNSKVKPRDIIKLFKEPIENLEFDTQENYIELKSETYEVDFELNNYANLIGSYMYVKDTPDISNTVKEQIESICEAIYPMKKKETRQMFDFKKIFKFKK